jgi:hypothetical protein
VTIDLRESPGQRSYVSPAGTPTVVGVPEEVVPATAATEWTEPAGQDLESVPSEIAILGFPRPGQFRVDESGRLVRTGAFVAAEFEEDADPGRGEIQVGFQPAEPGTSAMRASELPPPLAVKNAIAADSHEGFRPMNKVGVNITPGQGTLPPNPAAARFKEAGELVQTTGFSRSEPVTQFEWESPAMAHRPLFFEEVNLERHGYHVKHLQPFLSAAHFFGRVPAMPYLAASQRSRVSNYTLGHYRPGSCAPYVWYYPRPSLTGATIEGALITGLLLAIP